MADLMRHHNSFVILLRLQSSRCGELTRLLSLEGVGHDRIWFVVPPLALLLAIGVSVAVGIRSVRRRICLRHLDVAIAHLIRALYIAVD